MPYIKLPSHMLAGIQGAIEEAQESLGQKRFLKRLQEYWDFLDNAPVLPDERDNCLCDRCKPVDICDNWPDATR